MAKKPGRGEMQTVKKVAGGKVDTAKGGNPKAKK